MLIRPLVSRELLRECRRGTHFLGRTLFVAALAAIVIFGLFQVHTFGGLPFGGRPRGVPFYPPSYPPFGLGTGVAATQAAIAAFGTTLFAIWALTQYAAACIFSTIRAAALADERRIGSLPLMRTTSLLDRGIIVGWFSSVMGRALFTMLLALPVLVMSRGFGGFTIGQVALVTFVTIVAAAHGAALTLAIASRAGSIGTAVSFSLILQALVAGFLWFFFPKDEALWRHSALIITSACGGGVGATEWTDFFLTRLLLIEVYLTVAVISLKRPTLQPARPLKRLLVAADGFFLKMAGNRNILWKSGLGPCRGNPVLWRERAASVLGQRDHMIRITYGAAIGLVVLLLLSYPLYGWEAALFLFGFALLAIPALLLIISVVIAPASAFPRERQQRTMPLLAVCPLSARKIVLGKYSFCLRILAIPLGIFAVFFGLGMLFDLWENRVLIDLLTDEMWDFHDHRFPLLYLVSMLWVPLFVAQILYIGAGTDHTAKVIASGAVILSAFFVCAISHIGWAIVFRTVEVPFVVAILSFALLYTLASRVGRGVIKRTLLALLLPAAFLACLIKAFGGLRFGILLLAILVAVGTAIFLGLTIRQLDRLIGRYG